MSKPKTPALEVLPEHLRIFVEALARGVPGHEAVKLAGSRAESRQSRASIASRYKRKHEVRRALSELRMVHDVPVDGESRADVAVRILKSIADSGNNPSAAVRACEILLKMEGKLAPGGVVGTAEPPLPEVEPEQQREEVLRMIRVVLRGMPHEERRAFLAPLLDGDAAELLPADTAAARQA